MRILKLLLIGLLCSGILLAGCSLQDNQESVSGENEEPTVVEEENGSGDPVNETFEEDTINESDDVEVGELI